MSGSRTRKLNLYVGYFDVFATLYIHILNNVN